MVTARHHFLELLSEQDSCLIEGLVLSCDVTKTLAERYKYKSLRSDHQAICYDNVCCEPLSMYTHTSECKYSTYLQCHVCNCGEHTGFRLNIFYVGWK